MITTYSSRDYRITYQGIALIENALDRPDLVQVSVTSDCVILVAPQKEYGIDYEPNGEYRSWNMQGVNTQLARAEAHFIYARLNRTDRNALLLFSVNDYTIDGKINGEGEASTDYYYIKIGSITATDLVINPTLDREITIDFGYLTTAAGNEGSANAWRELFDVTADNLIRPLKRFTSFVVKGTLSIIGKIVLNDKEITDVARQGDQESFIASDEILPTTKLLTGKYLEELRKVLLSKDRIDSTEYLLKLLGGILTTDIKTENFSLGALGSGYGLLGKDSTGKSYLEIDKIFVRLKAIFATLEIMELTYSGGNYIFSPAGARCTKVEDMGTYFRCYFTADDGSKKVKNKFRVDDFVQCREFNVQEGVHENVANRYYWRRCVSVGEDYIDLSKTDRDMASDDAPASGDNMVTIGNKTDASRQNVIIISVYGEGSPSFIQYKGINSYSLDGKAKTIISPERNEFRGTFLFESGDDVKGYVDGEFASVRSDVAQLKIKDQEIVLSVSSAQSAAEAAKGTAANALNTANAAQNTANAAQESIAQIKVQVDNISLTVSTVEKKADDAQSAADSANSAISTVKTDVASLQLQVGNISLTVSSVEEKADAAQSTASSAASTASSAYNTAQSANSTASSAASTASSALSTASSALDKAENAQDNASSAISQVSSLQVQVGSITSTVSRLENGNELVSIINQTATSITIDASKINLYGFVSINEGFKVNTDGRLSVNSGQIGRFSIVQGSLISQGDASINMKNDAGGYVNISSFSSPAHVAIYIARSGDGMRITNYGSSYDGTSLYINRAGAGLAIESYGGALFIGNADNTIEINGLQLNSRTIYSDTYVQKNDDVIISKASSTIYLYLSNTEVIGKVLVVKKAGAGNVVIKGNIVHQSNATWSQDLTISDYPPRIFINTSIGWIELSGKHA